MKVLFATYPMAFHTPGGGEIQLLAYRKHLSAHGVAVTLLDPWAPRFLEHDIVHFFSCMGGSIPLCGFVKELGLPLVISSSLWITEETTSLYPVNEIRYQLSLADRVIANSDIECDALSRVLGLPREKFATVYNGVDSIFLDKVPPERFRTHFGIDRPFVLNVGNIEPRKNQLRLVRAMKQHPGLGLVLIGHVRDPAYAKEVFAEAGNNVKYLGPLPHDSELLRSAYAACEVFCLPSTLETPGLAALEAGVQGARMAVTGEGSTKEYFRDQVAYLQPGDVDSIADAINRARQITDLNVLSGRLSRDFLWKDQLSCLSSLYAPLKPSAMCA